MHRCREVDIHFITSDAWKHNLRRDYRSNNHAHASLYVNPL